MIISIAICLSSCSTTKSQLRDRYAHIQDSMAREIIRTSIDNAGGIELWESMKSLSYDKKFELLLKDGGIEKSYDQYHKYQYNPSEIHISSLENGKRIKTSFKEGNYNRSIDNQTTEVSQGTLRKAVNTSIYVVGMPFKLLDPGCDISYEGELIMEDGTLVDVIKVSYNAEQHKNHSTTDVWKYYFDKEDRKIIGNWVQTGDHFSLLENQTFVRVGGILFNEKRTSYRVDENGKRLFLRASYVYSNYEVLY